MYLRDCLIENVGPIQLIDLTLPFSDDGSPKPLVVVGRNGTGKSILLSHIVDALIEFAKTGFQDIVPGQGAASTPYFKVVGGINQRSGCQYGLAILKFSDSETVHTYVDKSGNLDFDEYSQQVADRFSALGRWAQTGNHKWISMPQEYAQKVFRQNAFCYFPSARHERPHWLNPKVFADEPLFHFAMKSADRLYKPVIVESAALESQQWALEVILDSLVEVEPKVQNQPDGTSSIKWETKSNMADAYLLRRSRENLDLVIKAILQDDNARLVLNRRSPGQSRLSVLLSDGAVIPSLDHLSAGQASLFSLFSTIIRYADRADVNKSIRLEQIEGIVLVDEIEAQAHSDLQYEALPKLIKLFPKVQFILTSHSPLFLLGMEKEFGSNGYAIVEMPSGYTITTERFTEFERSWEYYRSTTAYERSVERALQESQKPLVFTEGETDAQYLTTALELKNRTDIMEAVDIQSIGKPGPQGSKNSGEAALTNARRLLETNPDLSIRRVLLLYDSDAQKPASDTPRVSVRISPKNDLNTKVKKGTENLFPETLFEPRFYTSKTVESAYGETRSIETFDKTAFCDWICNQRRDAADFAYFDPIIEMLDAFMRGPTEQLDQ